MKNHRLFIILTTLALLLAAPRSAAAASSWTALGPFGGTVTSLAVDPDDARVVYATTGMEGVFKSTDAGATWTKLLRVFTSGNVAVAPGGVVYVSTNPGKVKKSTDGGAHWTLASQGLPDSIVTALAVDPAQPSRVFAALPKDGLWRSTDGGASWQPANRGLPSGMARLVRRIAIARQPAGTIYLGTDEGLWKSRDGGLSWRRASRGLRQGSIQSLAVSPTDPWTLYANHLTAGLFRSRDGGETWTKTGRQPSDFCSVAALAVSPQSPRLVFAGTVGRGIFRSTDGGERWTAVGPASARFVRALAVAPSAPLYVYSGVETLGTIDPGGVLASADGGLTWTRANRGLAALGAAVFAASPGAPGTLWTATPYGLFRSRNGGASWRRSPLTNLARGSLEDIALPPLAPSTAYVVTGLFGLWRTTDGGATWTEVYGLNSGVDGPTLQCLWAHPVDPDGLWGKSLGTLFQSTDGGATWKQYPELAAVLSTIADLAFAPSSPATVYVGGVRTACPMSYATLFRSDDGGATWTRADAGLDAPGMKGIAVDPVDPRRVYVAARGVWVSEDGGATWTRAGEEMKEQFVAAIAASPIAGVVWAATEEGRIFRSGNGGETWEERTEGFPGAFVRKLAFDPFDPRKLYAATSGGLYVTEDKP